MTRLWLSPAAMFLTLSDEQAISLGELWFPCITSETWLWWFLPQANTRPSNETASAWSFPHAILHTPIPVRQEMMVGRSLLTMSPVPSCPCVISPQDHSSVDSSRVPARTTAATRSDIPTSDSSPRSLVPQLDDQKDSSHLEWRQQTSHIHVHINKNVSIFKTYVHLI
jgi:hypothetical protein